MYITYVYIYIPGAVTESVEHWSSNPSRVKPMTYKLDTSHFLAKCSALLG